VQFPVEESWRDTTKPQVWT